MAGHGDERSAKSEGKWMGNEGNFSERGPFPANQSALQYPLPPHVQLKPKSDETIVLGPRLLHSRGSTRGLIVWAGGGGPGLRCVLIFIILVDVASSVVQGKMCSLRSWIYIVFTEISTTNS